SLGSCIRPEMAGDDAASARHHKRMRPAAPLHSSAAPGGAPLYSSAARARPAWPTIGLLAYGAECVSWGRHAAARWRLASSSLGLLRACVLAPSRAVDTTLPPQFHKASATSSVRSPRHVSL